MLLNLKTAVVSYFFNIASRISKIDGAEKDFNLLRDSIIRINETKTSAEI